MIDISVVDATILVERVEDDASEYNDRRRTLIAGWTIPEAESIVERLEQAIGVAVNAQAAERKERITKARQEREETRQRLAELNAEIERLEQVPGAAIKQQPPSLVEAKAAEIHRTNQASIERHADVQVLLLGGEMPDMPGFLRRGA